MKLLSRTFSLFFTASLFMAAAAAQQAPPAAQQQKLVLQLFRHSGAEPVYQEVPGMQWSPIFKPVRAKKPVSLDAP
ncbi:MAG TPA: hypothetical protein VE360_00555, partial [Pyrinomonadaceae bacterium]|nr:hypothetical protein [Pyrinomonadaceae bacterium]